ncbi:MAG: hypothetical protein JW896_18190 [Deltaproteobacteria bacterium]|nr:hypothetical protein [Deltaproteobacteria bacterium]
MTVETIDKRFCTVAVGKGFITSHQLLEALEIQAAEDLVGKKHRLIGRILFDLGFVTTLQIKEVLASMNSTS